MAASAFKIFKNAKKGMGNATIQLASGVHRLVLIKSGATMLSTGTSATTWASLKTDGVTEVTSGGGYSSSGLSIEGLSWTLSALVCKLDATDWSLSASADLSLIRACLIRQSASDLIVAYASLSSAAFDLLSGNKLTIQFNASGIFTLT